MCRQRHTRPCKKRKDGAPSYILGATEIIGRVHLARGVQCPMKMKKENR